jgi:hypothetical protein
LAALTDYETYLISLEPLRSITGIPLAVTPQQPLNHPYVSFETKLPLSFVAKPVSLSVTNLAARKLANVETGGENVLFDCVFCNTGKRYSKLTGY